MPDQTHVRQTTASVEQRVDAIEAAFEERGMKAGEFIDEFKHLAEEEWVPENGARVVAKAWTDPGFPPAPARQWAARPSPSSASPCRCTTAISSCSRTRPRCTTSSAARSARARPSRSSACRRTGTRTSSIARASCASRAPCCKEMGLDLPPEIEIRVWDTTADTRYMVLPVQPPETAGWSEEQLAKIVTKDSMIGVARLSEPRHLMDGMHDLGGKQGFGRVRHSPTRAGLSRSRGRSASTRSTRSRSSSASSTWTSTVTRSSAWSRATTSRPATTSARSRAWRRSASRRASSRARSSSGARRARSRSLRPARRAARTPRSASASRPATGSGCAPTTFPATCACRATSAARPASWSSESPAYPFPDAACARRRRPRTSRPTTCASTPRSCGPTRPTRRSCMSACSRAISSGRAGSLLGARHPVARLRRRLGLRTGVRVPA